MGSRGLLGAGMEDWCGQACLETNYMHKGFQNGRSSVRVSLRAQLILEGGLKLLGIGQILRSTLNPKPQTLNLIPHKKRLPWRPKRCRLKLKDFQFESWAQRSIAWRNLHPGSFNTAANQKEITMYRHIHAIHAVCIWEVERLLQPSFVHACAHS